MAISLSCPPGSQLERLRQTTPLVHNITNHVAMTPSANTLLAIGASPLMAHALEEIQDIVRVADVLCINIGTLSVPWIEAMQLAAEAAHLAGKPWVLDPVGVGASLLRQQTCRVLLDHQPSVIRGNASEILALAGEASQSRGVDSGDDAEDAIVRATQTAISLAQQHGCVVAMTGLVDVVTDGKQLIRITGGHPLMGRVTAMGCALSSVVAAFIAANDEPLSATASALACYAYAGECAGYHATGPGSFVPAFLDTLYTLDGETPPLETRMEITNVA
ncbi:MULTISPECIES: hydroxyethylthiazole kinase [Cobetia]|uniref:Hydroxyethylthiazole kinase n=1 Tax=Cobetia crustatorum TaxID=553385 RepID=A0A558HNQ3_9GAMM|nr:MULTISPECIES: hydroxyethylthiazole kinase [Cobetia]TVU70762.1 hydroxyethylthiazole kinase [Cobetia crustatorum]